MKTRISFRALPFLIPLLVFGSLPIARSAGAQTDAEITEAFKWYGTLGYPNTGKLPFVRVAEGIWYGEETGKPVTYRRYGFLVSSTDREFEVGFPDLSFARFIKTPAGVTGPKRIWYDPVDLELLARKRTGRAIGTDAFEAAHDGFAGPLELSYQIFVLSQAIAGRGNPELARKLFRSSHPENPGDTTFMDELLQPQLADRMARACVWETILKFDNVLVKRDVILDDYKSIVRRFPKAK